MNFKIKYHGLWYVYVQNHRNSNTMVTLNLKIN